MRRLVAALAVAVVLPKAPAGGINIAQGTLRRAFTARPTGKTGVYRARVVFPRAGTWRWTIWDGFSREHTYSPVRIAPAP